MDGASEAPAPTGIDYARLIDTAHQAELAAGVNYAALTGTDGDAQRHGTAGVRPGTRRAGRSDGDEAEPESSAGGSSAGPS
jgi:hypothetical protein